MSGRGRFAGGRWLTRVRPPRPRRRHRTTAPAMRRDWRSAARRERRRRRWRRPSRESSPTRAARAMPDGGLPAPAAAAGALRVATRSARYTSLYSACRASAIAPASAVAIRPGSAAASSSASPRSARTCWALYGSLKKRRSRAVLRRRFTWVSPSTTPAAATAFVVATPPAPASGNARTMNGPMPRYSARKTASPSASRTPRDIEGVLEAAADRRADTPRTRWRTTT